MVHSEEEPFSWDRNAVFFLMGEGPAPVLSMNVCEEEELLNSASDMEFLEVLTEGLERVLLVRGGGSEVITIYS